TDVGAAAGFGFAAGLAAAVRALCAAGCFFAVVAALCAAALCAGFAGAAGGVCTTWWTTGGRGAEAADACLCASTCMPPIMATAARIPAKAITLTRGVSVRSIAIPIGTRGVPLYGETREGAVARALSVKLAVRLGYAQLPA